MTLGGDTAQYRDVHVFVPSEETIIAMEINMILQMFIQFIHLFGGNWATLIDPSNMLQFAEIEQLDFEEEHMDHQSLHHFKIVVWLAGCVSGSLSNVDHVVVFILEALVLDDSWRATSHDQKF